MDFDTKWTSNWKIILTLVVIVLGLSPVSDPVRATELLQGRAITVPDIALTAGIQDRFSRTRGIAPADFDLDGDIDVFISTTGDSSRLFWNMGVDKNGDVVFEKGVVLVYGQPAYFTSTADYDNDGDPDIFIGNGGIDSRQYDYLFENRGGVFVDVTTQAGVAGPIDVNGDTIPMATGGGAWGDYDKDGWLDLYVTTHLVDGVTPRNTLYRNLGDGTFEDVTDQAGVGDTGSGWAPSWLDFDNDSHLDLYVANRSGPNVLYRNEGDGTFTDVTTPELALPENSWGSLTDDFDNNGWMDLFVVSRGGYNPENPDPHGFFINDGQGGFTNEAYASGLNNDQDPSTFSNWMGFQAGDLTNDGYQEIFLGAGSPPVGNDNQLFLNRSTEDLLDFRIVTPLIDFPAPPDGFPNFPRYPYRTHGIALVDFDEDGDLDILVGNGGPRSLSETREPNRLFRNDIGNSNNWVGIDLEGTLSNRDGIGSRIVVQSRLDQGETHNRHRMVKGISGFGGNNAIDPHIGIGRDNEILNILVWWPSGILQTLSNPPINRVITIEESPSGPEGGIKDLLSLAGL